MTEQLQVLGHWRSMRPEELSLTTLDVPQGHVNKIQRVANIVC